MFCSQEAVSTPCKLPIAAIATLAATTPERTSSDSARLALAFGPRMVLNSPGRAVMDDGDPPWIAIRKPTRKLKLAVVHPWIPDPSPHPTAFAAPQSRLELPICSVRAHDSRQRRPPGLHPASIVLCQFFLLLALRTIDVYRQISATDCFHSCIYMANTINKQKVPTGKQCRLWRLGVREGKRKGTLFWGKQNVSLN
jgi:hypothetical protein